MRCALVLLIFVVPTWASEETLLHEFKIARADPFSPRGKSKMDRAIASLAKDGGVKSVAVLADFLRETHKAETEERARRIEIQRRGRVAHSSTEQIKRELEHLRHRENAGATGLGPQINARTEKMRSMESAVETAKIDSMRSFEIQGQIWKKRESSAHACALILARLKPDETVTAIGSLRKALDVDQREPALLLVRVLRESKRKEAAGPLLEVFSHPKADTAGRASAACAIPSLGDGNATRQLVKRLQLEKQFDSARVLHALGLAAHRRFADLDEAAKWAATLK